MQTISCEIDITAQRELPISQLLTVSVTIGNFMQKVGTIRLENSVSTSGMPEVSTVSTRGMSTTQIEGSVTGGVNLELLYLLIPAFAVFVLVAVVFGTLIGWAIIKMKKTRYLVFIILVLLFLDVTLLLLLCH